MPSLPDPMRLDPMRTLRALLLGLVALAATTAPALAAGEEGELDAIHHTADGYYLDFTPFGKIELPRLFLARTAAGGYRFDVFPTSTAAVASGRYRLVPADHGGDAEGHGAEGAPAGTDHAELGHAGTDHAAAAPLNAIEEMGYTARNAEGDSIRMEFVDAGAPYDGHLAPTDGGAIVVDFSITRHLVFIFLAITILCLLLIPVGGRYVKGVGRTSAPRGLLQNLLETLVVYVRDEIAKPNLGEKHRKYLPYLLTAFFFVLTANLLGLIPFGATATANITVTALLALFTFVITQFAGTKDYWAHIFNPPGIPGFVKPILVPVEVLGLFTKPIALAIRLFANMTAGHLVILNLVGLIFIVTALFGSGAGWGTSVPALGMMLFVYGLEVLVAFIQAYVFTTLSALFIGMASAEHEHDHDHSHEHDLDAHDKAVSLSTPLVSGGELRPNPERTVGTEAAMAFSG